MMLTFTHLNQLNQVDQLQMVSQRTRTGITTQDFSVSAYYMYDIPTITPTSPDACEFLSSSSFLSNPAVQACREIDMSDTCGFSKSGYDDKCRIAQTTLSYDQSIQTNIIEEFEVSNTLIFDEAQVQTADDLVVKKYTQLRDCITEYVDDVKKYIEPNIKEIVKSLDLALVTGEGDLMHQFVDCIFMGALQKNILAPADTDGVLENLMYSRQKSGIGRDFELPCVGTTVYDRENPASPPFIQKTCGSDTRISLMAYVSDSIMGPEKDGLHLLLTKLIQDKLQTITSVLEKLDNYGCARVTELSWRIYGEENPPYGRLILSKALQTALSASMDMQRTMDLQAILLTRQTWLAIGLNDLRLDDYIQIGFKYFQPNNESSWKYCCARPGYCEPGESTFDPNLPEIDTFIRVEDIVETLNDKIKTIEEKSILDHQVLSCAPYIS